MATWSAYPSLLNTLPMESWSSLEAVAEARQCGRHEEGHEIFKSSLPNASSLPILAFEYADLLTDQGLEGERAAFLEEAVRHLHLADESSEQRLLDLMLADSQLWAYGSLRNAVEAARRSRTWLGGDPTDHLSDLRVRGIQLYHQLMQRGSQDSKWVDRSELTAFEEFNGDVSAECAALSLSLTSQGSLAAAARMMVKQMSETGGTSLAALCHDVATFCDQLDATNSLALLYRSAYTRLSVTECAPESVVDLAQECQSKATAQLQKMAEISGTDWSSFAPKLFARLQTRELRQSCATAGEEAASLLSVANRLIDGGDYMTATQVLNRAVSASRKLANQAADHDSANRLWKYSMRLLDLHRQTTKSVYFEAIALQELVLLTDLKMKAHEEILNEVAEFASRTSLCDVPMLCVRLYGAAITAARETGRDDLLQIYDRAHDKAFREYLSEEQVPKQIVQVITRVQKNSRNNILKFGTNAVEVALMWAKDEYQNDMMSQLEWEELFGFYILKNPERQESPAFSDFLERVHREYESFSKSFFDASREDWVVRFSRLREWLESNDRIPWDSRHFILTTIAQAWGFKQRSDWMKKEHTDDENAHFRELMFADIALETEIKSIGHAPIPSMVGLPENIGKKDENVFRVITQIKAPSSPSSSNPLQHEELRADVLDKAIQDSEDVFQEYQKRQNYLGMFTSLRRQAEFLWNKFLRFKTARPEDAIAVLSRALMVYDEVRRKRSVPLAHHYSIAGKMQQLHKYDAGDVYDKAICWSRITWNLRLASLVEFQKKPLAAEGGEAAKEERQAHINELDAIFRDAYAQFVLWTQKSKSRAILDLLSLDTPIPQELLEECNSNPHTADMIRRERDTIQKIDRSAFPQSLKFKEELDELRGEMRQHPLLKRVMKIRDGEPIDLKGITEMLAGLPDRVILVDFIYVDFDKPLRALCYRKGLTYVPALMHNASMDVLSAWTKNLARPSKKPLGDVTLGKESLSQLTPILLPLFKVGMGSPNQNLGPVIRPGDTIVFFATGVLHNLPLHAIPIDGIPVIEKHPVVYCPSLTVLQHCLQMATTPQLNDSVSRRLVLNPMPGHWDKAESKPVKSTPTVEKLAKTLGAKYLYGCDLDKNLVKDSLNGVSIFHYHGHVQFERKFALKSHLILDKVLKDNDTNSDSPSSEKRLTAEDIFSCRLANGALTTLVGCRSGGADVSTADDVLGIPMAMYYAGAAATVSSLWKLHDEDGAAWADAFYDDLLKQTGAKAEPSDGSTYNIEKLYVTREESNAEQGDGVEKSEKEGLGAQGDKLVNLALAMQRAVRRLRFDVDGQERAPYHWAGYTLSGSWMFPFTSLSTDPENI